MKAEIIAGWKTPEEKIGDLDISGVHGEKIVSVILVPEWMKNNSDLFLDPDIDAYAGSQYPSDVRHDRF